MAIGRAFAAALLLTWAVTESVEARSHYGRGRGEGVAPERERAAPSPRAPDVEERGHDIRPSGLVDEFPSGVSCPAIASPYASTTRFDGSPRPVWRHGGRHGGIDITLEDGTPLRAVAAGRVLTKGEGGLAEGIYLWLQHVPEDTGLPFWAYTKYQHFSELPTLAVGERVRVGDVVGLSGRTGTQGRHFGSGYPHLHLSLFGAPGGEHAVRDGRVVARGASIMDPVALFVPGLASPADVERLPAERRRVPIPWVASDGTLHPPGTRLVWPVACARR